jgi:hypothetical protein
MAHHSASFSFTLRVRLENRPGTFADLTRAIADAGGLLDAIDLVRAEGDSKVRDVSVLATNADHVDTIRSRLQRDRRRRGRARMEVAAGHAIAATISEEELAPDYIVPSVFNREVVPAVAAAVARAAEEDGVARRGSEPAEVTAAGPRDW